MARPRKKAVPPPAIAAEAVDVALTRPFDSFGMIAGAMDRFGPEAVALAVIEKLAHMGVDSPEEAGLTILLAQTGAPGQARAALDLYLQHAFATNKHLGMSLLFPVACAGVELDPAWVAPMDADERRHMAHIVGDLAVKLEPLLLFHGGQRLTPIAETVRVLRGE
jgi:hypothetical protein